jgi:hypothetical protein
VIEEIFKLDQVEMELQPERVRDGTDIYYQQH